MLSQFNMTRFIDLFIDEARETLQKIEKLLLNIEQNDAVESDEIHDLFRYIHTLKGNSSSIGFVFFSRLSHELENFLDLLRHETLLYSPAVGEILIKGYELLNDILHLEISKTINDALFRTKCDTFIQELTSFINDIHPLAEPLPLDDPSLGEGIKFGFFGEIKPTDISAKPSSQPPHATGMPKSFKESPALSSASIRINLEKIDNLMNGIGELVIAMSMLEQYAHNLEDNKIKNGFNERIGYLRHTIRDLQDSVMSTRMVPMEHIYSKFPKLIRDISKKLQKEILFKTNGDDVEIDKAMIEGLSDPLMHIIRNACDHGIESSEARLHAGKSREGTIHLSATYANEQIMITISDDGRGIDSQKVMAKALSSGILSAERSHLLTEKEKINLIFEPGLSTAEDISDISGRGVGMDVVRSNINRLGGSIQIESTVGEGTTLRLLLPLTLAIVDVLTVVIGDSNFFLPLSVIIESLQPEFSMIKSLGNHQNEVLILREEAIPIIRLHEIFNLETHTHLLTEGILIIVRYGTSKVALLVDMFLNQQQVVIKSIEKNFKSIEGFSGASIKGDGTIGLILDVVAITEIHKRYRGFL